MKSELSPLLEKRGENDALSPQHETTASKMSWWEDDVDTVQLGMPIFVARLSWVGMKMTDSALLGHVSAESLAAAALRDLYAKSTSKAES